MRRHKLEEFENRRFYGYELEEIEGMIENALEGDENSADDLNEVFGGRRGEPNEVAQKAAKKLEAWSESAKIAAKNLEPLIYKLQTLHDRLLVDAKQIEYRESPRYDTDAPTYYSSEQTRIALQIVETLENLISIL